ncbi:PREDICTED: reversion-inducing cysteine-rich protein with Kazal motifs [Nicrophorus vespilloides]|uniref:Reversion-inducing cysteine-rich protein with Kazal motifs n=1 Tax=Nicrophorus vespilloides TaxID=110193 RepID=A0ABM1M215_NICVS|nr:PREDICTED: reversion-inducing cysteine-rich protein with Kazal motifs [Nicrophorus vespilloides]
MCCSHATGSCKSICEKISLVDIAADAKLRNQTVQEVQKFCSPQLNNFWECLNTSFEEMSRGESWFGRVCCPLPQSENCRRACVTANSIYDLSQGCRKSDEISFFNCLDRQYVGYECCSNARSPNCKEACLEIFKSRLTPTRLQRNMVLEQCEYDSPKVLGCVKNFIKVTPATNLHKHMKCCEKSNKNKCREACKEILSLNNTLQETMDGLQIGGCGFPLFQDQFWQCFMKPVDSINTVEISRIDRVGMDSAKWHCCSRASTNECRKLCSKTFLKDWSTLWDDFHLKCLSQVAQEELRNCIDEVDEPCELGCDGLSFCTNFNNRPTELFRSCTPEADDAARNDVTLWQTRHELTLPGLTLPLKNISKCSPNTWKAVACTLQIKPCSRVSHANQICRNVCLNILSDCVDWSRVPVKHSPETICAMLSPEDPAVSCISLESFLAPSGNTYESIDGQVSSPCKGDPCKESEICTVNKNCLPGKHCSPYKCTPGCKLGEVSEYLVPEGTYVRIPLPNNQNRCLKICKCTSNGIDECQPLPCVLLGSCWNNERRHGEIFHLECNKCTCYAGEMICSKKQCENSLLGGRNTAYTTLPCNCPPHFVPVCGRNGNIYPSACLAKCAGLSDSDIEYGACQDPCRNNPCAIGKKCVPDTKICLSLKHKPCTQFQCINGTANCGSLPKEPVCDVDNKEYANSCFLAHNNRKFAYQGPCLQGCAYLGEVCGINGKTYISECAAIADYVSVDYVGPCVTVGAITDSKTIQCPTIKCKPLPRADCLGFTPPGACCPICGGSLRLLYSTKQIDRALYVLQTQNTQSLTLKATLQALERQIQVAQCSLKGYLTVEVDIFVVVQSTEKRPTALQLEACVREAEKIASLINRQSPRVQSEISLSSLVTASVVHTVHSSATITSSSFLLILLAMTFLLGIELP